MQCLAMRTVFSLTLNERATASVDCLDDGSLELPFELKMATACSSVRIARGLAALAVPASFLDDEILHVASQITCTSHRKLRARFRRIANRIANYV